LFGSHAQKIIATWPNGWSWNTVPMPMPTARTPHPFSMLPVGQFGHGKHVGSPGRRGGGKEGHHVQIRSELCGPQRAFGSCQGTCLGVQQRLDLHHVGLDPSGAIQESGLPFQMKKNSTPLEEALKNNHHVVVQFLENLEN